MNKLFYIFLFFILSFAGCVRDPDLLKVQNLKGHNVKVVDKIFIYSQSDIDNNFKNADEVIIDKLWINKDGEYDFKNIIFSYSGKNKKCKKSTSGWHPFIIIRQGLRTKVNIKNLIIKKSAPDGIDIQPDSVVKFENLKLLHSCDEGLSVRNNAKIELINSKIISQYNKGIQFGSNNHATIINSKIISEQALTLSRNNLNVTIDNSIIERHPHSKNGRLITGKNCSNISIKHTNTKFVGLQHLDGTINCSNVKINGKSYNQKSKIK